AKLTIDEQIQSNMPATWRDGHLSQLDPDIAQRYEDARREELQEIKRSLMKKRRPDYYGLGDDDEDYGGVGECFLETCPARRACRPGALSRRPCAFRARAEVR